MEYFPFLISISVVLLEFNEYFCPSIITHPTRQEPKETLPLKSFGTIKTEFWQPDTSVQFPLPV